MSIPSSFVWAGLCSFALVAGCGFLQPASENSNPLRTLDDLTNAVEEGNEAEATQLAAGLHTELEQAGTPLVSGDTATFVVFADANTTSVRVLGAFDEKKGEVRIPLHRVGNLGLWIAQYQIRPDAEFPYNVDIAGQVSDDPLCKRWIFGFGKHSVARMPDFDPWVDRAVAAEVPRGTVESLDIKPKTLGDARTLQVYLPPGYAKSDDRYSVLYVHDGTEALEHGHFDKIADYLIAEGRMQPILLCFVPHGERIQDYLLSSEAYADFLANEVVPVIDARYRTLPDRAHRGVTGASLGGRISTFLVLHHTDVFGICIGQSSYFLKDSPILKDLTDHSALPVRFYYDVGVFERAIAERDLVTVNRELRDLLTEKGCEVTYREWPGTHCWFTWSRGFGEALPLYWPAEPPAE